MYGHCLVRVWMTWHPEVCLYIANMLLDLHKETLMTQWKPLVQILELNIVLVVGPLGYDIMCRMILKYESC